MLNGNLKHLVRLFCAILLPLLTLAGCDDYPNDPENTLHEVTGGTMVVGLLESPPWVELDGAEPAGIEVDLVRGLARDLDSRIEWVGRGDTHVLEALEKGEIDVVIGGLTQGSPWSSRLAFTSPYYSERIVAVSPQSEERATLDGLDVVAEPGTLEAALVRSHGGVPVPESVAGEVLRAAKPEWRMEPLEHAVLELATEKHVVAVPKGENAFLIRVDRYFRDHTQDLSEQLRRSGG